jgi:predicted ArsR family transcriptional regulator
MALPIPTESTKGRVLNVLRERTGGTAQEVADVLGVTVPAARRHLMDLEAAGLIHSQVQRPGGRGRPQHVFMLTADGEHTFPRRYAQLCHDILEHVESLYGSGAVLEVLSARNTKLLEAWQERVTGESLQEKLCRMVVVLNQHGYEASIEYGLNGDLYLLEGNCPSLEVARQYGQLCTSEAELYSRLLGVPVTRETQITRGASSCRYRVG